MKKNIRWYLKQVFSLQCVEIVRVPDLAFSPGLSVGNGFTLTFLRDKEIPELMEFHDSRCVEWNNILSAGEAETRLKDGHLCCCARKGGKLVGFHWYAPGKVFSPDLHCLFESEDTSIVAYNGFVDPVHRGNHLLVLMMQESFRKLSQLGYEKVYTTFRAENLSPKITFEKFRSVMVGKIFYGYLLGYFLFFPLLQKDAGVRVRLTTNPWHRWRVFFRKRFPNTAKARRRSAFKDRLLKKSSSVPNPGPPAPLR